MNGFVENSANNKKDQPIFVLLNLMINDGRTGAPSAPPKQVPNENSDPCESKSADSQQGNMPKSKFLIWLSDHLQNK
jgi:hypothetical protein